MKTIYAFLFCSLIYVSSSAQNCNYLCNGNFDSTIVTTSVAQVTVFTCWQTTASDGKMEVWANNFNGVPSYNGSQFIELNANQASSMYQDFNVGSGILLSVGFAHRGRAGTDTMEVAIGPVGGPYTKLGRWGDGNAAWGYYTSNYTTATAGMHRLLFTSIYAAGGNIAIGNFLDAVSVRGLNTFSITSNAPLCAGNTLSLSTSVISPTYTWTGPNNYSSTATSPTVANTSTVNSGFYFLTLPNGCAAQTSVTINQRPILSILNISGSQTITCTTPSVDLQAISIPLNLNYFWSSTSFTSTSYTVNIASTNTLITLTTLDPTTNCSSSATTAIFVNTVVPISSVNPINQNIICGSGSIATATGVAISPTINVLHTWYGPGGVPGVSSGGQVSIFNPAIVGLNGTSTFVVTNLINGCSTTKTIEVTSNGAYPTLGSITSGVSFNTFTLGCSTRSVIDVNIVLANTTPPGGSLTYTLLPPSFTGTNYVPGPSPTYTVNTPGTYIVVLRDNFNNCESRIPLSIIQNTYTPEISAAAITRTLSCNVPSVVLIGSSTTPNVDYNWRRNTSATPTIFNSQITITTTPAGTSVPSATVIDTYTLTITDRSSTCLSTSLVTMYQNTRPPVPRITLDRPALTCSVYSINLGTDNKTGILPNTFFINAPVVATLWEGPTPEQPAFDVSTYLGYTPGTYTMTAKDKVNGCTAITTTVIGDNRDYPVIVTSPTQSLDCGSSTGVGIKLGATVIGLAATFVDAEWTSPPNANVSSPNSLTLTTTSIGSFTLSVTTKSNSCKTSTVVTVINGVLDGSFTPDQTSGFAPLTVNFNNTSSSSSTVTGTSSITTVWSYGNGTMRTTNVNIPTSAIYAQPGTYTVAMFTSKGTCLDTVYKVITVDMPSKLEVPNVFTPNGDNSNDIFFIKTANLSEITAMIYDRWGNKIYELTTDKGNIAWDGKTQTGKEAPDGTYFYIITAKGKDGQNYDTKGTVSLYR